MLPRSSVLIIDDEEVVLDSCSESLAGGDCEVATARDGLTGLRLLQEFQPDVVFVDLKMPGLTGLEVLERIQSADPTVVAIVITGYATIDSAVEAMKKGAYDFLPKPFTPDQFRLITRRALEKRRLVRETLALRREKELLRDNFAAVVSHEVKAPLTALQQNLYVLTHELRGQLNEAQQQLLQHIQVRVENLLKLIHTWLRVLSVDIDKIQENFRPVEVSAAVASALESVGPLAERMDVALVPPGAGSPLWVRGDEGTLAEALVNLLSNAVKYSHAGSQVFVATEQQGDEVLISVRDTGVGIAREDLPYVFEAFYTGRPWTGAERGCGLGLTIARRIFEAHHGSIAVESAPGQGSTFLIRLPVLASEVGAPQTAAAGDLTGAPKGGGG